MQYVCAAYATSLVTLALLYAGLPTGHFPIYAQLQGFMNMMIVASALGVPTAAVHLGLLSQASPGSRFSLALEQGCIQLLASVLISVAIAMPVLSSNHGMRPEMLYPALILTASCGLYPLWGVGITGLYRKFALTLIVLKCFQWILLVGAESQNRLWVWMFSQAAIYLALLVMFVAFAMRQGMAYRPTRVRWRRVLSRSLRSDLALDLLKALWANWLQLLGGAAAGGEAMNRVLVFDRVGKAAVSFLDNVLRLRWYAAANAKARHFAHWGDRHLAPAVALTAAGLAAFVLIADWPLVSAFALTLSLMGLAAMLALLNGAAEWSRVRGAYGSVRHRSVAVAAACIAAAALFWFARGSAPDYLALCLGVLAGEMLIALRNR